ncbi:ankyrin, partial [Anaeromyces robustus]
TPLIAACTKGNEKIVKYLIDHGADVNKKNMNNRTPLIMAFEHGNKSIIKYLVEHGA